METGFRKTFKMIHSFCQSPPSDIIMKQLIYFNQDFENSPWWFYSGEVAEIMLSWSPLNSVVENS